MAAQKRQSRKRRNQGSAPRAVQSQRREQRAERRVVSERRERQRQGNPLGSYGERPESPFGGLPVSELLIFAGGVALVVGFIQGGGAALIVGFVVCALGVVEVTAREHFSGYRSHTLLLAAIPTVGVEFALVATIGSGASHRTELLAAVIPVFLLLFWVLRKRFQIARQARVARPPST